MASHAPQQFRPGPPAGSAQRRAPVGSPRPHPWELLFHPFRTLRFIAALATDPRVSALRKLLYVVPLLVLLIAVLLPEGIIAAALAVILPLVGPAVNVPADAALDWFALAIAAYGLLGVFPEHIVREHHARLFHPRRS